MEQSTTLHALIHTILAPYDGQTVDGKRARRRSAGLISRSRAAP